MKEELFSRLRGVSKDFGGLRALDDVDLDVKEGEIVALIGPKRVRARLLSSTASPGYTPPQRETLISIRKVKVSSVLTAGSPTM